MSKPTIRRELVAHELGCLELGHDRAIDLQAQAWQENRVKVSDLKKGRVGEYLKEAIWNGLSPATQERLQERDARSVLFRRFTRSVAVLTGDVTVGGLLLASGAVAAGQKLSSDLSWVEQPQPRTVYQGGRASMAVRAVAPAGTRALFYKGRFYIDGVAQETLPEGAKLDIEQHPTTKDMSARFTWDVGASQDASKTYEVGFAASTNLLNPEGDLESDRVEVDVVTNAPPVVTVTSPTNGQVFGTSPVTISGTVTDDVRVDKVKLVVKVRVGGRTIVHDLVFADVDGTNFTGQVELREGGNQLHIWAYDHLGREQRAYVGVTLDADPDIRQKSLLVAKKQDPIEDVPQEAAVPSSTPDETVELVHSIVTKVISPTSTKQRKTANRAARSILTVVNGIRDGKYSAGNFEQALRKDLEDKGVVGKDQDRIVKEASSKKNQLLALIGAGVVVSLSRKVPNDDALERSLRALEEQSKALAGKKRIIFIDTDLLVTDEQKSRLAEIAKQSSRWHRGITGRNARLDANCHIVTFSSSEQTDLRGFIRSFGANINNSVMFANVDNLAKVETPNNTRLLPLTQNGYVNEFEFERIANEILSLDIREMATSPQLRAVLSDFLKEFTHVDVTDEVVNAYVNLLEIPRARAVLVILGILADDRPVPYNSNDLYDRSLKIIESAA